MIQHGTVVNGVIVPDGPPPPNGTRVVFESDEVFDYPHPMAPYDREKEFAILRESIEEMKARGGMPLREAMAQIAVELNLPHVDTE